MKGIGVLFLFGFLILIGRLVQLQLIETESYSKQDINLIEASINQRTQSYVLDEGRGTLLDKNGTPMSDSTPSLVLFPFLEDREWPIEVVASIVNESPKKLERAFEGKKQPFTYKKGLSVQEMEKINQLSIPGVYAVYKPDVEGQLAGHVIGSVRPNPKLVKSKYPEKWEEGLIDKNTKLGISGLQLAFDPFLISEGDTTLLYHADRQGNPLLGLDVKMFSTSDSFYPLQIKTTLDLDIQSALEKAVDEAGIINGGAVLIDIETNNLRGMVSRPLFNTEDPLGAGAVNQMVKGYFPGSVFKTVVLAAAYEHGISNSRTFNCDRNLYRDGPGNRKLGTLDLKNSFAVSCNAAFTELAEELIKKDPKFIENTAEKLGIASTVGWEDLLYHYEDFKQLPDESNPVFFKNEKDKSVKKAIDQTAIGQLNVKLSPLAIANMMSTIGRGGEPKQVRVVSDILYRNHSTFLSFKENRAGKGQLSKEVVKSLQQSLREVVVSGTGRSYLNDLPFAVAGKSGTAELGENVPYDHQWFAGYFPYDSPRYALVVVDYERKEKEYRAYKAFAQIVTKLYESER
ncbi:penicillin-binding protein 2 [Bacillus sp. NTK071]|uniref:peptidoglycan D,D-transpeptidase FtsI family protein n=1 Tax=Bacillus sp. NTK071 TaxID=2802175 RepID=UPI001A8C3AE9|nr:penicillin-binding transpeptidase domain-containing protein [Bacillus sp. NTK071]MBN8208400.1 penicillin-binding protein 2 [Bacillus sp. NTK071]